MAGLSQTLLAGKLPASRLMPLMVLPLTVTLLIAGCDARSLLIAAPWLFWKVSPVSVGLLDKRRKALALALRIRLLVKASGAPLTINAPATLLPPAKRSST